MKESFDILIVDDNEALALSIQDMLNAAGYEASVALDAKGALTACREKPFDLMILDYKLPDMDGLDLQKRMTEISHSDCIIITAYASLESAAEAVHRRQIVGYETKPLDMDRLLAFIQQVKERRLAEGRLQSALDQTRQHARETDALLEAARAVLNYRDFEPAARRIFDICADLIGATAGYVALLSEDNNDNELVFLESGGLECGVDPSLPMPIRGLRAEAYRTGKPVYDNDFANSPHMEFMPEGHAPLKNVLFVPLKQSGKAVGVIGLANKPAPFTDDDARLASGFAEFAAISLHNAAMVESLEAARKTAVEATRAKTNFLAHMSHEIRTPMNAVVGMSHILNGMRLSPQQRDCVETILAASDILLSVIDDILDFSKIEAGRVELETVNFDLDHILREVTGVVATRAREKGIWLGFEMDDPVPRHLAGDLGRLRQVLLNLANNAVKFTETGSVRIQVSTDSETDAQATPRFSVADTGIGIPADRLEALFDPFSQADASISRRFGGTGLGLAISRKIVEMMGGEIGVESEPGIGSTFWFTVVLDKVSPPRRREAERRATDQTPCAEAEKTLRILVAEDNFFNQKIIQIMLGKLGAVSDIAQNGEEAIRMLGEAPYDLVLMDIHMPVLDGMEATRRIRRSDAAFKDIPIIALTADAMVEHRDAGLAAGLNGYLIKPLKPEALKAAIDQSLCEKHGASGAGEK